MLRFLKVQTWSGAPGAPSGRDWVWSVGLVAAALGLATFRLADKGLWLDEVASLSFALGGPETWLADHNMGLYYALLAGIVRMFGIGELALRSLSVLSFALGALALRALGAELFGERVGRIAGGLFVLNACLMHFAQEARGYMLEVLLVSLAGLALSRLVARRTLVWSVAYGLLMGLACYAHLFALWVALAHLCVALVVSLRPAAPRGLLLATFALVGVLAAPLVLAAWSAGSSQVSWIYPPSFERAWGTLVLLVGGSPWLACLEAALFVFFLRSLWVRSLAALSFPHLLLGAWLVVPVLLSYAYSWWVSPIAHPKYLIVIVPALLVGVAAAIDGLPMRLPRGVSLAVIVTLCAARLHFWYAHYQKERWREVVALLAERARRGDVAILDVLATEPLDYYVESSGVAARMPISLQPARELGYPPGPERPMTPESTRSALARAPRVWLVQNRTRTVESEQALLRTHRQLQSLAFEPYDEDDLSLFADSSGRVITVRLFARTP